MYCENCGVEVLIGSPKRSNCGKPITMQEKEVSEVKLKGKKVQISSTGGIGATFRHQMESTVKRENDRLYISVTTTKKNLVPEMKNAVIYSSTKADAETFKKEHLTTYSLK